MIQSKVYIHKVTGERKTQIPIMELKNYREATHREALDYYWAEIIPLPTSKIRLVKYYSDTCNSWVNAYVAVFSTIEKAQEYFKLQVEHTVENEIQTQDLTNQFNGNYDFPTTFREILPTVDEELQYEVTYSKDNFEYSEEMDCTIFNINIEEAQIDKEIFYTIH